MVDGPNVGVSAPLLHGIQDPPLKDRAQQDLRRYPRRKQPPRPPTPRTNPEPDPPEGSIGTRLNVLA